MHGAVGCTRNFWRARSCEKANEVFAPCVRACISQSLASLFLVPEGPSFCILVTVVHTYCNYLTCANATALFRARHAKNIGAAWATECGGERLSPGPSSVIGHS